MKWTMITNESNKSYPESVHYCTEEYEDGIVYRIWQQGWMPQAEWKKVTDWYWRGFDQTNKIKATCDGEGHETLEKAKMAVQIYHETGATLSDDQLRAAHAETMRNA